MTETRTYRGGRTSTDSDDGNSGPVETAAEVLRKRRCFADGCPMPGTIFVGITQGGTGAQRGTCAWHYGVMPSDIPKVTKVLQDWGCVSDEVNAARRALTGDAASDPKALDALQADAWRRLAPLVELSGYADHLKPGNGERYDWWSKRLHAFLGARVVEVLSTHRRQAA